MEQNLKTRPVKYFGTDGIRGEVGVSPMDREGLNRLAQALEKKYPALRRVVLGRDTRQSGAEIQNFLIGGFSAFVEFFDCGIVPSPLLSKTVVDAGADLGIMITASHNPACDNGVKIFNRFGAKVTGRDEADVERELDALGVMENRHHYVRPYAVKTSYEIPGEVFEAYPSVVIDCAHGSAIDFARKSYHFPKIHWLGDRPNGANINAGCGSEHPETLLQMVRETQSNLGIAHDGDGDRLLLCDRNGQIFSGETILGAIAIFLEKIGHLRHSKLVTTAMANGGLAHSLKDHGIEVVEAEVGDRNVAEKMNALGCNLGGEPSGHIIFFNEAPTSDGIQSALLFLRALSFLKLSPEAASDLIKLRPRATCSIAIKEKIPLQEIPHLGEEINNEREKLGAEGKIFIRYSGTEPKLRLLVEAPEKTLAEQVLEKLKNSMEIFQKSL